MSTIESPARVIFVDPVTTAKFARTEVSTARWGPYGARVDADRRRRSVSPTRSEDPVHDSSVQPFLHLGLLAVLLVGFGVLVVVRRPRARNNDGGAPSTRASTGAGSSHGGPRGGAVVLCGSLTKRYGEVLAVDQVTFSLPPGSVTGFLGPNGAGKSTTLRVMLGLAAPSAGEALVLGRRYRELDDPIRQVGAVLESGDFHPGRTGRDHLRTLALAGGIPVARVDELLELVELADAARRRVRTYSLGMRQRLGLAAALLGDPELLVLDEPANGLDPAGVRWLRTFVRGLADEGRTVLVSSHLLAEVAQTVDRVLIIDRGRLLADAPLCEMEANGQTLEEIYLELTEGVNR